MDRLVVFANGIVANVGLLFIRVFSIRSERLPSLSFSATTSIMPGIASWSIKAASFTSDNTVTPDSISWFR